MDGIDLSSLKAAASARVAEEEARAALHKRTGMAHAAQGTSGSAAAAGMPGGVAGGQSSSSAPGANSAASSAAGSDASAGGASASGSPAGAAGQSAMPGATMASSHGRSPADTGSGGNRAAQCVVKVTTETFQREVLEMSRYVPVVVDLWSETCQPCKQLSPILEKLAHEYGGKWVLATVNIDKEPALAQVFQVQSVPMVIALAAGRPLDMFAGAQPEPQLRGWLDAMVKAVEGKLEPMPAEMAAAGAGSREPEPPSVIEQAEIMAASDDMEGAQQLLREHIANHPRDHEAAGLLAMYEMMGRAGTADGDAVTFADEHPDDIEAQCTAADVEMTTVGAEVAFTRLLNVIARTAGEERQQAQQHLVKLFSFCDAKDPLVIAARTQLASLLF